MIQFHLRNSPHLHPNLANFSPDQNLRTPNRSYFIGQVVPRLMQPRFHPLRKHNQKEVCIFEQAFEPLNLNFQGNL